MAKQAKFYGQNKPKSHPPKKKSKSRRKRTLAIIQRAEMENLDYPDSMMEPLIMGVLNVREDWATSREIAAAIFKIKYLMLFNESLLFYSDKTKKNIVIDEIISQKPYANSLKNNVLLVLLKSRKSPTVKEIVYKLGRYKKYKGVASVHRVYQVISELKKECCFLKVDTTKITGEYVEHRYSLLNLFNI